MYPIYTGDVASWAQDLISVLEQESGSDSQTRTIYDTSGRIIIGQDGLYAYDPDGTNFISPTAVSINTEHLVEAAVDLAKLDMYTGDSGVEFPASPTDGDIFFRTDNDAYYEYDADSDSWLVKAYEKIIIGRAHIANAAIQSALIADAAIVEAKIADLAVTNAKIANLNVGKLTSGDFTGQYMELVSGGNIRSGQTAFDTGIGFWLGTDGDGDPAFSIGDSSGGGKLTWDLLSGLYLGDGDESYIQFVSGKLTQGLDVEVRGVDAYNNTSFYLHKYWDSADGCYVSDSAKITTGSYCLKLGDGVDVYLGISAGAFLYHPTFDKKLHFTGRIGVTFKSPATPSQTGYYYAGARGLGKAVGFKVANGNVYGFTTISGSTYDTVSLGDVYSGGTVSFVLEPGVGVTFYYGANSESLSNIPTGLFPTAAVTDSPNDVYVFGAQNTGVDKLIIGETKIFNSEI